MLWLSSVSRRVFALVYDPTMIMMSLWRGIWQISLWWSVVGLQMVLMKRISRLKRTSCGRICCTLPRLWVDCTTTPSLE